MSLNRFYNRDRIVELNKSQYGQMFTTVDLDLLDIETLSPYDPKLIDNNIAEVHLFTLQGDYLGNDNNANYIVQDDVSNSLLIDLREAFNISGIDRGAYKIVINLLKPLFGTDDNPLAYLRETSPDRTELKIELLPNSKPEVGLELANFAQIVNTFIQNDVLNYVVFNFGFNRIVKIRNIKFKLEENAIYVKLYDVLPDEIIEKDKVWVAWEVMDPYTDQVVLTAPPEIVSSNTLSGPNFNIDITEVGSTATTFKSFNDLLDSDTTTNQMIIDSYLSGSDSVELNIDYTDFINFVFYGSAQERIENFYYKKQLIEYYDDQVADLNASSGSALIDELQGNVTTFTKRKDAVVTSFSDFEKWLYYEPTASIFTHGVTGSLTPYPKYISGSRQYLHHSTHSLSLSWYNEFVASGSAYDLKNYNRLVHNTPEHIIDNANNSQYLVFLDMMGEHFDNLYAYVRALTSIYERDEHPQRGMPNKLLPAVAQSMGWKVQNTKTLQDLWLYAAGRNISGSLTETGSLFSKAHENLNYQVWRRIVNNMPYLLKTKGTQRSVKALLSIYGIPHTLISIKEYGGPPKEEYRPQLIEDRFAYKLNFDGDQYIQFPWRRVLTTDDFPSKRSYSGIPESVEFRFSTEYSSSISMSLWAQLNESSGIDSAASTLDVVHANSTGTASYSGSYDYGYLRFRSKDSGDLINEATSSYLPLFDGDMWNVHIHFPRTTVVNDLASGYPVNITVQKSGDCSTGLITHSSSFSMIPDDDLELLAANGDDTDIILGGMSGSGESLTGYAHRFSGSLQNYREYVIGISSSMFNEHTLNPGGYHHNSATGSYYELYRYFPLGGESIRHDHTTVTTVTSSRPYRSSINSASFIGFTGTQATQYTGFREEYYIYTPSIGGNNIINEKIRLEDNSLKWDLNPEARAEKSRYDFAAIDNNRLAIVFSPTDQINREIFNHTGFAELDEYIGDPGDQYEYEYKDLRDFNEEYWKKWSRRYNLNEFIKIFSIYDYSVFTQIRQLIPARADLIDGVLIEPHILERPKVPRTRPSVEQRNWTGEKDIFNPTQTGLYLTHTSSLVATASTAMTYCYYTSSAPATASTTMTYCYYTSSTTATASVTASYCYHTGSILIADFYTGSLSFTQSIVDKERENCKYQVKTCYYTPYTTFDKLLKNDYFNYGEDDWTFGEDEGQIVRKNPIETLDVKSIDKRRFLRRLDIQNDAVTTISQNINTVVGKKYIFENWVAISKDESYSEPYNVLINGVLKHQVNLLDSECHPLRYESGSTYKIGVDPIDGETKSNLLKPILVVFTGSGTDVITMFMDDGRDFNVHIYSAEVYPNITPYQEEQYKFLHKCIKRPEFCILNSGSYQIDECGQRNKSRFVGSKLTGADFNIDSDETIDGGPVVSFTETNPNRLIVTDDSSQGNLKVE